MEWLQKLFSHYCYDVSLNKLIGFDIRGHKRSGNTNSQEIDFLWFALFIFSPQMILNHGSVIVRVSLMEILNIMAQWKSDTRPKKVLVKVENQISYLVKARLAGFVLQVEEIRSTLSMLCASFLKSSIKENRKREETVSGASFLITAQPTKANSAEERLH